MQLVLYFVCLFAFMGALLYAAACDLTRYVIPNWLVLSIAGLFPIAALLSPEPIVWLSHFGAAALVFVVGLGLFRIGIFGGGDVKLWTAVALWSGFDPLLYQTLCITLLGGALGVIVLAVRVVASKWAGRFGISREALPTILKAKGAIPYGVAIAGGAILSRAIAESW